jgi:hypothetical protein
MKAAAILFILLGLGVGGLWYAHGMHMATESKAMVEKTSTDDFGDKVVTVEWQELAPMDRKLGLDFAAPGGGGLVGLGMLLLFINSRRNRGQKRSKKKYA